MPGIAPTHSSLSWLCPNCIPVLWVLALGTQEVAGKAHPHLSVGWDEVMGPRLTPSWGQVTAVQAEAQSNQRKGVKTPGGVPRLAERQDPPPARGVATALTFHIYLSSSIKTRKRKSSAFPSDPVPAAGGPSPRVVFQ